jgi:hypothetical protein
MFNSVKYFTTAFHSSLPSINGVVFPPVFGVGVGLLLAFAFNVAFSVFNVAFSPSNVLILLAANLPASNKSLLSVFNLFISWSLSPAFFFQSSFSSSKSS